MSESAAVSATAISLVRPRKRQRWCPRVHFPPRTGLTRIRKARILAGINMLLASCKREVSFPSTTYSTYNHRHPVFSHHLNISSIALRFNSARPLARANLQSLSQSITRTEPSTTPEALPSLLQHVCKMIQESDLGLTATCGIEMQLFFSIPTDSKPTLAHGRLASMERSGSVLIAGLQHVDSKFSKPFGVHLPTLAVTKWCQVHVDSTPSRGWLECKVNGHIKPGILEQSTHATKPRDTESAISERSLLQDFVHGMLKCILDAVQGKHFAEPNDMLTTVKESLPPYLRASLLRQVVDFREIQMSYHCSDERAKGACFAFSSRVNAGGTELLAADTRSEPLGWRAPHYTL